MTAGFFKSILLLLVLLNPFLLILYLTDLVQEFNLKNFSFILIRAGIISSIVFTIFAIAGDTIFSLIFQSKFASFQIFGGIVLLIIGTRFVFLGNEAINGLRGKPEHIAGSIAMPIMIGPGTVSVSIIIGKQFEVMLSFFVITLAVSFSVLVMICLKMLHDYVKPRNDKIVERYLEIMGRILALIVGTFSIEMIMQGFYNWINN